MSTPLIGGRFFDYRAVGLTPGACLYSYSAGTLTPLATYTDAGGGSSNANPVVLNAYGQADVFLGSSAYRMRLYTDTIGNGGTLLWDEDNITSLTSLSDTTSAVSGAGLVGFNATLAYASSTVGGALVRRGIYVDEMAGANDTQRLAAAFAAVPAGGEIIFTEGGSYTVTSVNFTGKSCALRGQGATIACTSATGAIYKTDHGNKLSVYGVKFTSGSAGARAINHQVAASGSVYDELVVVDCIFAMDAGTYGVYCVGTREPRIERNTFYDSSGGNGVYCKDAVSPFLFLNIFKGTSYTARAVYYQGSGNATDCGLILRDCEILGYDKGVEIVGCDWFVISGCTIDYCNWSVKIAAQDGGHFSNNYIGSLGANPALWITYDAAPTTGPNYSDKIIVEHNSFTGHYTGGNTYDCILVDGATSPDNIQIKNNAITFYTRYGVQFTVVNTTLMIEGNTFNQRGGFGVSPIYNASGAADSSVFVKHNRFNNATTITAMNLNLAACNENGGCLTEAKGEVIVPSGNSTYNVAHGLSYTPAKTDVHLTPTNSEAAGKNPYISSVDATNVVVGFTTATAANAGVRWGVRRGG